MPIAENPRPDTFYFPYTPEVASEWKRNQGYFRTYRKSETAQLVGGSDAALVEVEPLPGARILYEGTSEFRSVRPGYTPKRGMVNQLNKGESPADVVVSVVKRARNKGYHAVSFVSDDFGTYIMDTSKFRFKNAPKVRRHHRLMERIYDLLPEADMA